MSRLNNKASSGPFSTVCVVGLGYVGLPTAAIMASRGLKVLGVDTNVLAVDLINQGKVHIIEPDLDILVNGAVAMGKLKAAVIPGAADAFIIAVPTPFKDDHVPNLSYVEAAAHAIAPFLQTGNLVIIESTSPVGTTEQLSKWLAVDRPDLTFPHNNQNDSDICVAHSPERVLPGRVLIELVSNDRVIGGITEKCAERAGALYDQVIDGKSLLTTARTAELVKLAENAYRDVNIAFANELGNVCYDMDIDVWKAIELANHHPRVNILAPGPGVGGHCIAVDPWFIVDGAPDQTPLIQAARLVNDLKPRSIVAQIKAAAGKINSPTVACLGLAYKADIDDLRESPAVDITRQVFDLGITVLAVEPHVNVLPKKLTGVQKTDLEDAVNRADIIVLLTDHSQFKNMDKALLTGKTVIDSRGIWRS